jgi:hypothetical protein
MKIKFEHWRLLQAKLIPYLEAHPELTKDQLLQSERLRWDAYWASGTPINNAKEFNYLSDSHIDTAIKTIIREMK